MRIGIVNDTVLAREALRRVVLALPEHDVAWMARDGAEAIAMARQDPPDLILMDLFMPGVDGVEATRRIMGESPCAILVVTATVAGHLSKVYQAMGYGALDAVDTPTLGQHGELRGAAVLLHKIELIGRLAGKGGPGPQPRNDAARSCGPAAPGWQRTAGDGCLTSPRERFDFVVLGASTGGPQALAEILGRLPARLGAGIVIVQHVDAAFAPGLGQWLSEQARRPVTLVADGHRVRADEILLSGTDDHLVLGEDQCLHYSAEPRSICYRPSVDVFFASVARNWPRLGVAALLTGMLHDGAHGLLALRRRGWRTIAQDEATSVVWGMPRAAIELGAAELVLPLPQIAGAIARLIHDPPKESRV
ncbi:MAG TPA: chemotaxis-specific protein-glutamate methyltransferase CheB [Isosphaeraceae bacterium]|nr:chemotaxis-specific protein-glutamate methyltransferase CheB [Isosphaeraceae bacterium]